MSQQSMSPFKYVGVSDNVFHELHDRFDRGESNVCSGMSNGEDRPLWRDSTGFMRSIHEDAVIVRRSHFQAQIDAMPGGNEKAMVTTRHQQKVTKIGDNFDFQKWQYGRDGKPTAVVYANTVTGKKKVVKIDSKDTAKECNHCGVAVIRMKRCGRCKNVSYCCKEHQTSDWKTHKIVCK